MSRDVIVDLLLDPGKLFSVSRPALCEKFVRSFWSSTSEPFASLRG
ncbi:MAG: hypothetical protein R3C45_13045 [Phycisphaerales bacterium]